MYNNSPLTCCFGKTKFDATKELRLANENRLEESIAANVKGTLLIHKNENDVKFVHVI